MWPRRRQAGAGTPGVVEGSARQSTPGPKGSVRISRSTGARDVPLGEHVRVPRTFGPRAKAELGRHAGELVRAPVAPERIDWEGRVAEQTRLLGEVGTVDALRVRVAGLGEGEQAYVGPWQ